MMFSFLILHQGCKGLHRLTPQLSSRTSPPSLLPFSFVSLRRRVFTSRPLDFIRFAALSQNPLLSLTTGSPGGRFSYYIQHRSVYNLIPHIPPPHSPRHVHVCSHPGLHPCPIMPSRLNTNTSCPTVWQRKSPLASHFPPVNPPPHRNSRSTHPSWRFPSMQATPVRALMAPSTRSSPRPLIRRPRLSAAA